MLLTMDIGNTNIKIALFRGQDLAQYWRISTDSGRTSDEYGILLASLFGHCGLTLGEVDGIMISSVVPTVNFTIEHMCDMYFGLEPHFLTPDTSTGIRICYENPRELGSDRIANAVAAYTLYGGPCIFIDFGTATSYGVVTARGEFAGGAIAPGIKLAAEALVNGAARLPRVELQKPDATIARTTVSNMQSGLIYGYVGSVDYLVTRMKQEIGDPATRVIATGGMARLVTPESAMIDQIDGLLTLKGLRIVYERSAGERKSE
ncbi:MAG: type III pantothenate kinase [Oscillospiraceae bacterium]|jgi:type III pantothenate kinase|nr:type III pantothenate kinase [Oscillospiraceae bacterium]